MVDAIRDIFYLMTIANAREKCKTFLTNIPRDVLIILVLITTATLSFGLGYLAGEDGREVAPAAFHDSLRIDGSATSSALTETAGVVASKNGTKYYLPTCAGANRISEKNKVWFATIAAAVEAGYTPAANCNNR